MRTKANHPLIIMSYGDEFTVVEDSPERGIVLVRHHKDNNGTIPIDHMEDGLFIFVGHKFPLCWGTMIWYKPWKCTQSTLMSAMQIEVEPLNRYKLMEKGFMEAHGWSRVS
jgi:hypothetical protein